MKAKKQTAGERIVMSQYGCTILGVRESSNFGPIARRIDAAIRRAVREAWKESRVFHTKPWAGASKDRIERKYGVRL